MSKIRDAFISKSDQHYFIKKAISPSVKKSDHTLEKVISPFQKNFRF